MMKMTRTWCLLFLSGFLSITLVSSNFHLIDISKTYKEAKSFCRETYIDLATVHNSSDMNDLIALAPDTTARAWIGLEFGNVSKWHWSMPDHKVDFFSWLEGEPHKSTQAACAAMDPNGKWFENDCNAKRRFVCHGNGSGPIFVAKTKSWRDSQNYCRGLSSDLVSIHTAGENEAVHNVSLLQNVWIGLFKDSWKWSDGSNSSFRYWKPNQPNYLKNQHCVAAVFKDKGQWNDLKCKVKRKFICHGAIKSRPTLTTTKWAKTQQAFTTGQMPTNLTTQLTDVITLTPQSATNHVTTKPEITINKVPTGKTTDTVSFLNSTTKPSDTSTQTTVSQITTDGISSSTTPTSTQITTGSSHSQTLIPAKVILIQENMTWIEAMNYCREHHADLVYIPNKDIQEKVAEITKNATSSNIWLGLRYACTFNFWFWIKSTAGCYHNWAPGQGTEVDYGCGITGAIEATGRQQWVGLPETEKLNFICSACPEMNAG